LLQEAGGSDEKEVYEGDVLGTDNELDGLSNWLVVFEMSSDVNGFATECLTGGYSSVHTASGQIGQLLLVVLNERLYLSVNLTDFALQVMDGLELLHIHTHSDLTFPIR
jgi:hypothetical protein